MAGCATTNGDRAQKNVAAVVGKWAAAMQEQDVPAMMQTISRSFHHNEWGDREGFEAFMLHAVQMGYLEGVEIALENSVTAFEGDMAIVSPVGMAGSFGQLNATLTLARESRAWQIVGLVFNE